MQENVVPGSIYNRKDKEFKRFKYTRSLFVSKMLGGLLFPEICNKFYLIPEQMSWVNKVNDQEDNVK